MAKLTYELRMEDGTVYAESVLLRRTDHSDVVMLQIQGLGRNAFQSLCRHAHKPETGLEEAISRAADSMRGEVKAPPQAHVYDLKNYGKMIKTSA